jgi:hypothetical protein
MRKGASEIELKTIFLDGINNRKPYYTDDK